MVKRSANQAQTSVGPYYFLKSEYELAIWYSIFHSQSQSNSRSEQTIEAPNTARSPGFIQISFDSLHNQSQDVLRKGLSTFLMTLKKIPLHPQNAPNQSLE